MKYCYSFKNILLAFFLCSFALMNAQPCVFISNPAFQNVNHILESENGDIWVATQNGLLKTDMQGTNVQHIAPLSGITIYKLFQHQNKILAGTLNNGVYIYDGNSWTQYTSANGLGGNTVVDFTVDNNDRIWMASSGGVSSYKNSLFNNHTIFADDSITAVKFFQGAVYAGNYNNEAIKKYINGNWHIIQTNTNIFYRVKQIEFGMAGELLFRTANRIYKYDGWNWKIVDMNVFHPMVKHPGAVYFLSSLSNIKKYDINGLDLVSPEICENIFMQYNSHSKGLKENSSWLSIELNGEYFIALANYNKRQRYTELQTSTLSAGVPSSGTLFNNPEEEVNPYDKLKTNGKNLASLSALWIKANLNGNDEITAGKHALIGQDWFSGPIAAEYDYEYLNKYDRVWKVSKQQIKDFKQNYRQFNFLIPEAIRYWPGNGDTTRGEAWQLAPYVDYNNNNIYEPELGDHPMIKGDEAVFFMINDARGTGSKSRSLHAEVHAMVYWFDEPGVKELEQSLFLNYKIYNRSGGEYKNMKMALVADHHLGNPFNDLMGCDSRKNLVYAYNYTGGDNGPGGFGNNPPTTGWLFLSDSLSAHIGFHHITASGIPQAMKSPESEQEQIHFINTRWNNGTPLKLENPSGFLSNSNGTGYTSSAYPLSNFQYDEKDNWFMPIAFNYDFIQLSIIDKPNLQPGDSHCMEVVYTHAYGQTPGSPASGLQKLKNNTAFLKQYYINNDLGCMLSDISEREFASAGNLIDIYPNPAVTEFFINNKGSIKIESLQIMDINGRILKVVKDDFSSVKVAALPSGVYMLNINLADGSRHHEVVMRK